MPSADDLKLSMSARLAQMGDNHYQLGQMDKAIDYYRQAMAIAQRSVETAMQRRLLMMLALTALRLQDFNHAREHYDQALQLGADSSSPPDAALQSAEASLLVELGKEYYRRGDYGTACSYLESAAAYARALQRPDEKSGERLEALAAASFALITGNTAALAETCQASLAYAESANDDAVAGIALAGLGLAELLSGRPSGGIGWLDQAAPKLVASRESMFEGEARAYRCLALVEANALDDALEQARHIINHDRENLSMRARCATWVSLGLAEALTGDFNAALATCRLSLDASRDLLERGDPVGARWVARSLVGLAMAHEAMGKGGDALAAYREALIMAEETGDPLVRIRALLGLGSAALAADVEEARATFREARAAAQETGSGAFEALALMGLGQVDAVLGQQDAAGAVFQMALGVAQKAGDQRAGCRIHLEVSAACRSAGQRNEAVRSAQQALEIAQAGHFRLLEGQALGEMGLALVETGEARKAAQAAACLVQALELAQSAGDSRQQRYRGGLASAYVTLGEVQKAVEQYSLALAAARDAGDRLGEAAWLGNLANLYAYVGQARRAIDPYQQAIRIGEELGDQPMQANLLVGLGLAYSELDQLTQAVAALRSARALFESLDDVQSLAETDQILRQLPS